MCAHGDGQLDQHVDGVDPRGWRIEPEQRRQQRGAVRQARGVFVHYFDLVALQHGHVDELSRLFAPVVLDDEQPRPRHFQHEAIGRDRAGRSPHLQLVAFAPDAQMDPGALDGRRHTREGAGAKRQRLLEDERVRGLRRRDQGKRDLRDVALLASETRPERRVDDGLDRTGVW